MTDVESKRDREERELLSAALLAQTGCAPGEPPSDEELVKWLGKRLVGDDLARVEKHIAMNPDVFARAMALRKKSGAESAGGWLQRLTASFGAKGTRVPAALAGVAVLVLAVAGILNLTRSPDSLAPDGAASQPRVLRSASVQHADWRVAAFRAGFQRAASDTPLDASAAIVTIDRCMDGDDCAQLAASLTEFGKLLAQVDRGCRAGDIGAVERTRLAAAVRDIDAVSASSLELSAWRGHFASLADALQTDSAASCEQSAALQALLLTD